MDSLETLAPLVAFGVLGLFEVFAGYRLFRFLVVALGVLAGFAFGPELYGSLIGETPDLIASAIVAGAAGLLFGLLAYVTLLTAAFVWVALLGFTFAGAFLDNLFLLLLVALAAGLLVVFLERPVVIVLTSLHGAWLAVAAAAAILGSELTLSALPQQLTTPLLGDQPYLIGAALLLALAGIVLQASAPPRRRRGQQR